MNKKLIIILIVISVIIILSGCVDNAPAKEPTTIRLLKQETNVGIWTINVIHDDEYNVTCWTRGSGISCIPDSQLDINK